MKISAGKLSQILQATTLNKDLKLDVLDISIDSRSLRNNNNTLFFALKGTNHDAHAYINDLYSKGVRYFVVSKKIVLPNDAVIFNVSNTLQALQLFVADYRSNYHFPVIGITGSNGKTIVKEWLNQLLMPYYNIIKSPKSYNSQVGVPLSVIAINEEHNLGVFEAGISQVDEMDQLQKIIQPTIGILTNIGPAHNAGFKSIEDKLIEKLKLFKEVEVFISEKTDLIAKHIQAGINWFNYSFSDSSAHVFFTKVDDILHVEYQQKQFKVALPFNDLASVQNIATCITTLLFLKVNVDDIVTHIPQLQNVQMRLQVKKAINDCLYNLQYYQVEIHFHYTDEGHQGKIESSKKYYDLRMVYEHRARHSSNLFFSEEKLQSD